MGAAHFWLLVPVTHRVRLNVSIEKDPLQHLRPLFGGRDTSFRWINCVAAGGVRFVSNAILRPTKRAKAVNCANAANSHFLPAIRPLGRRRANDGSGQRQTFVKGAAIDCVEPGADQEKSVPFHFLGLRLIAGTLIVQPPKD